MEVALHANCDSLCNYVNYSQNSSFGSVTAADSRRFRCCESGSVMLLNYQPVAE